MCASKKTIGIRHHMLCLFTLRYNLDTNDIFSMKMADFVSDENFQGVKPKKFVFCIK